MHQLHGSILLCAATKNQNKQNQRVMASNDAPPPPSQEDESLSKLSLDDKAIEEKEASSEAKV